MRTNGIKTFNILDANQPVITIRFNRKKLQEAMAAATGSDVGSTCNVPSSETFHSSTTTRMTRNKKRSDDFKSQKKHNTRASKLNSNGIELPRSCTDQFESYGFSNLSPEAAEFQPREYSSPPVDVSSPGFSSMPANVISPCTARPTTLLPLIEETGTMVTHDIPPLKTSSEASCDDSSDFDSIVLDLFSSVGSHTAWPDMEGSSASSIRDSYDSDSQISVSHQSRFYVPVLQEKSDLYHSCLSLEVPWYNWIHVPHGDSYAAFTRGLLFVDGMTCTLCEKHPAKRDILSWDRLGNYKWNYYCSTLCRDEWTHNCRIEAEVV